MIESDHPRISTARQCRLLGLPRSTYYHRPQPTPAADLAWMRRLDEVYLAHPEFGARQLARWFRRQGYEVNRKRMQRLMRLMGLEAIYQKPNLSRRHPEHRVHPYRLRNLTVARPNQVWATEDLTYRSSRAAGSRPTARGARRSARTGSCRATRSRRRCARAWTKRCGTPRRSCTRKCGQRRSVSDTVVSECRPTQVPARVWRAGWWVHWLPAGSGENVVKYLARYVHRTAISDERILAADDAARDV
jgi:hypothetical protein